MVGEPDEIEVSGFEWDDLNQAHLARHDVAPEEVEYVRLNSPLFFRNLAGRMATHMMIGRDQRGRILYVALTRSALPGLWRPITGWESRFARRLFAD